MNSGRIRALPHGLMDVLRHGNLGVLVLPLLLLAAGWGARARLARKTVKYSWHGVELRHPVGWTAAPEAPDTGDSAERDSVVLTDLLGPGRIKPRITLRIAALPPHDSERADDSDSSSGSESPPDLAGFHGDEIAAPAVARVLFDRLPLYYALGTRAITIGGSAATRIDSAFAFTPRALPGRKPDIPVVMRAIDVVFLRGSDALSVQAAAPIEDFETQQATLEAIVSSLRLEPEAALLSRDEPAPSEPQPPAAGPEAKASGDVTVAGQVIDADSGLAVPGAIVLFLTPGTSVDDVSDDNLTQSAYTTGLADSTGHFASNRALNRPAHYGVMVVADGYRWIGSDDGLSIEDQTPDHVDVGAVRLRRR